MVLKEQAAARESTAWRNGVLPLTLLAGTPEPERYSSSRRQACGKVRVKCPALGDGRSDVLRKDPGDHTVGKLAMPGWMNVGKVQDRGNHRGFPARLSKLPKSRVQVLDAVVGFA
ncbi:hypothetical protein OG429_38150 [Streptomyces sp. NBC_00190]|uniref:hypothetical protein n=1 Tax=Streptomyces sp. NBC_00190 TaxID=2903634 RepID=UPI002E2A9609|nr:hypothetical protein [Streptomyces sp. NBC_00190]